MANGITINQNTTLHHVADHLNNDANKDRQLLARTNKHGDTVLYTKPHSKNVLDKVSHYIDRQTGRTERREERAKNVVLGLVKNLETTHQEIQGGGGLFKALNTNIKDWSDNRQLTGLVVSHISEGTRSLPVRTDKTPPGPTLSSLGIAHDSAFLKDAARNLAGAPNDANVHNEVAKNLGDDLVDEIIARHPHKERDAFAMSNGFKLMDEMGGVLKDMLAKRQPPVKLDDAVISSICRTAFLDAASKVREDGVFETVSKPVGGKNIAHIQLGGQEYEPTRLLGKGGFGEVYEFVSVDDPTTKIAVKISTGLEKMPGTEFGTDTEKVYAGKLRSAADEINMHRNAYGQGSNEVVGLKGHFRMPDGNIAVAMELAPNGGVDEMGKLVSDALKSGGLSKDEANIVRLTMMQDMTKGLAHMHGTGGMTHLDFKPANCFIGSDGTTKLGDFGMSLQLEAQQNGGLSGQYQQIGALENPRYKAPELLVSGMSVTNTDAQEKKEINTRVVAMQKHIKDIFPHGTKDTLLKTMATNVLSEPIGNLRAQNSDFKAGLRFDSKVDVWSLGMSGVELFSGGIPFNHMTYSSEIETRLLDYTANSNNTPLSDPIKEKLTVETVKDNALIKQVIDVDAPKLGSVGMKTGNDQIDDLLTRMLKPKPEDRDGTAQLLNHAAFNMAGVGSKEAHDLIVALKSGDQQQIANARQSLQDQLD